MAYRPAYERPGPLGTLFLLVGQLEKMTGRDGGMPSVLALAQDGRTAPLRTLLFVDAPKDTIYCTVLYSPHGAISVFGLVNIGLFLPWYFILLVFTRTEISPGGKRHRRSLISSGWRMLLQKRSIYFLGGVVFWQLSFQKELVKESYI